MPVYLARLAIGAAIALAASLSDDDVLRAIAIAKSSDAERARFHASYVAVVREPIVERLEAITPFRRAVMAGEERYLHGDRMFGVRQIRDLVRPWDGRLTIRAELKFHPHNAYIRVPNFDILLGGPGSDAVAGITTRDPVYQMAGPGTSGREKPASIPILGASIQSEFDVAGVSPNPTLVRITLDGSIVAMTTFDFGRLE